MSYRNISYNHITEPKVRDLFHRADLYLGDAYSMFYLPYKGWRSGGGCNFTIVLVLLCVVDGIAKYIYPTEAAIDDPKQRFKKLLRERLFWGSSSNGWIDSGTAAKLMYVAFRNPLVHQLGQDNASGHPMLQEQPIVGKWGRLPLDKHNIDRVDRMKNWNVAWPTMYADRRGGVKLSASALYWSVKEMVTTLAAGSP